MTKMADETIKLEFSYINFSGNKKLLTLEYLEKEIINASEYLKIQFSGKFAKSKIHNYDLTCIPYPISSKSIKFAFDYATSHSVAIDENITSNSDDDEKPVKSMKVPKNKKTVRDVILMKKIKNPVRDPILIPMKNRSAYTKRQTTQNPKKKNSTPMINLR
jgi:hypothetical protein